MSRFASTLPIVSLAASMLLGGAAAQEPAALPSADQRYKVDLMLVVAHPDDEGAATAYLARALDEHKRVAVVISTRGSSGANKAGTEQAAALGDIREIEARNALATLGITNVWFLDGKDTASQSVLQSLANWGHGVALEKARAPHSTDSPGSDPYFLAWNFYWRRPRRPPGLWGLGHGSV